MVRSMAFPDCPQAVETTGRFGCGISATSFGQAPDPRAGNLQAVPGGVAEIEGSAAARPGLLVFDLDSVVLEMGLPAVQLRLGHRKADMAGPVGAMRGHHVVGPGRLWAEQEQHPVAQPEEHEDVVLLAVEL